MVDITQVRREGRRPNRLILLVPGEGVEPTQYLYHRILSPKKALFGTAPYKRIRAKTTIYGIAPYRSVSLFRGASGANLEQRIFEMTTARHGLSGA